MTAEEATAAVQTQVDQLIADAEDELDRGLDDEERESLIEDFLAGLDDTEPEPQPSVQLAEPAPAPPEPPAPQSAIDFDELAAAFFRQKAKASQ